MRDLHCICLGEYPQDNVLCLLYLLGGPQGRRGRLQYHEVGEEAYHMLFEKIVLQRIQKGPCLYIVLGHCLYRCLDRQIE